MLKRLAVITTHPIQYNAPWFRLLAQNGIIQLRVFYTWSQAQDGDKYDPGFAKKIEWDLPLLEGYDHTFVKNTSAKPGSNHFNGIINPTLNKEIQTWCPDAILVFGWSFKSHLQCLRYFHKKVPVLFRGDSTLLDEKSGIKKYLRRFFLSWVYRHVDFALYVGSKNREYFLAHALRPGQLIYAPHAIDNDRFSEPNYLYEKRAADIRKELNIGEKDLVILFAGKLEAKKNPFFLIHFLKSIADKRLKILFVGTGGLFKEIELAAEADKRILLLGFQNQKQMPVIYRLANLFILPSIGPGETWGLALNEAMASGRAVVASDKTGGAIDLIENGMNGLVIDLKDDSHLVQLTQLALGNKEVLTKMGMQSCERIRCFTFQHIVVAIENVMDTLPSIQKFPQPTNR